MALFSFQNILVFLGAYLLGSVPTALWVGKIVHGIDIRKHGSGNLGATNTIRVLGPATGVPVLILDILKGYLATRLAFFLNPRIPYDEGFVYLELLLGLAAVIGHILPAFARFNGGKGIATLFGMILGIHLFSALSILLVFILVFLASRMVSLGSILAALFYPLISYFIFKIDDPVFLAFTGLFAIIVLYTHRKNIKRIFAGNENKLSFSSKKDNYEKGKKY